MMSKLNVLKFGGSSVATTSRIKQVAEIVKSHRDSGERVVVVTSAMQGVTNQLIELARSFSENAVDREYDAIVSTGEQVAAGLLSLALKEVGVEARSLSAWQIPIHTTGEFSNSEISKVETESLFDALESGIVPVVTGFQGLSDDRKSITTLGRGGSDATACAIANAISANECFIYTDVDGIYTSDPRIVLETKRISEISYDDMLLLARAGSKVLQAQSVAIAKKYNVNLRVLSSFTSGHYSKVTTRTKFCSKCFNIAGIAYNLDVVLLRSSECLNLPKISNDLYTSKKSQICEYQNINCELIDNIGSITIVADQMSDPLKQRILGAAEFLYQTSDSKTLTIFVNYNRVSEMVNTIHKLFW